MATATNSFSKGNTVLGFGSNMTDIDCYELICCSDFIILPGFIDFVAQDVVSNAVFPIFDNIG